MGFISAWEKIIADRKNKMTTLLTASFTKRNAEFIARYDVTQLFFGETPSRGGHFSFFEWWLLFFLTLRSFLVKLAPRNDIILVKLHYIRFFLNLSVLYGLQHGCIHIPFDVCLFWSVPACWIFHTLSYPVRRTFTCCLIVSVMVRVRSIVRPLRGRVLHVIRGPGVARHSTHR